VRSLACTVYRSARHTRTVRPLLLVLAVLVLAWLGGFAWFVHRADRPDPAPPVADGIAVLTGGADRVRSGLLLLAEHRADRLLVSGIGGHAGFTALAQHAGIDPAPLAAQVTLGRGATSTRGNAAEIAAWARANELHSLIVVTAFYHMPRALAEIGRALPDVTLYPASVSPADAEETLTGLRLLADEYMKFLATKLDLSAFGPSAPPLLSPAHSEAGE